MREVTIPTTSGDISTALDTALEGATGLPLTTARVADNQYTVNFPAASGNAPLIETALTKPWIYSADGALAFGAEVATDPNVGDVVS